MSARRLPLLVIAAVLVLGGAALIAAGIADHRDEPAVPPLPAHRADVRSAAAPARGGVRLRLAATWRLPAAVQLPALAAGPRGHVVAAGGLSAADVSVPDMVRLRPGPPRRDGQLPLAVHDAAAAAIGGATYVFGGGTATGSSAAIIRTRPGPARTRARLPAPSSGVEAGTGRGPPHRGGARAHRRATPGAELGRRGRNGPRHRVRGRRLHGHRAAALDPRLPPRAAGARRGDAARAAALRGGRGDARRGPHRRRNVGDHAA